MGALRPKLGETATQFLLKPKKAGKRSTFIPPEMIGEVSFLAAVGAIRLIILQLVRDVLVNTFLFAEANSADMDPTRTMTFTTSPTPLIL